MSTYYYFACDRCKEYGGWFSRQAWGWGNMDIIDTFAFLANHAEHVDHYQEQVELRVVSEHDVDSLHRDGWVEIKTQQYADEFGLSEHQRVEDYALTAFPRSDDWENHAERFAEYAAASRAAEWRDTHPDRVKVPD